MVRVESYAGYRADEWPLRFFIDGREFAVERVVSRSRSPECESFRVETHEGLWDLRHELPADTWTAKLCARTS
jgi:hypothetical protein